MAQSITLTNTNGKKYRFFGGEVNSGRYGIITKVFKAPMPEDDGDNQIVINLGTDKIASGSFKLLNIAGSDAAVGTHTSTVETIQQKVDYILNTFLTNGVNDLYSIDIETTVASILAKQGIIENFNFNFSSQNPNSLSGEFSLGLGGGNQSQ